MTAPLADLRVIAVEQYGAGPWATMQLADLGADVIKIEDPAVGGDVGRRVPPYQDGDDSLFFESFNRGKRSLTLDLRHPDARPVLRDLVSRADALLCNLRGDLPARLGLQHADFADVNPRIVCCSLSAFGTTGPRAPQGGYDFTIQGIAGWQSITGGPDDPPMRSGLSLVDFSAGYVAALATLAGVWRARLTGMGCDADVSLFESALSQLTYFSTWVASRGYEPRRFDRSAHQSIVPFQNFRAADGWLVVACPKEHLWRSLCAAVGLPGLADDPRYAGFAARQTHRAALVEALDAAFRTDTVARWVERLERARVPCAPINDIAAALADPQVEARGVLREVEHPRLGTVRQVASPLRLTGPSMPLRRAPSIGEHTHDVLASVCGYPAERIAALERAGVFGGRASAGGAGATAPE